MNDSVTTITVYVAMHNRILIADDYDDNRELLRIVLETGGYAISEARNGRECIRMAQEESPDLALDDISMPEVDGWSVLIALRSDERTLHIPCVALTAFVTDADRQRALDAGFDAYIGKPYKSKDVLALVDQLLIASGAKQRSAKRD